MADGDRALKLRRGVTAPAGLPVRATIRFVPGGAAVEMNSAARGGRQAARRYGRLVAWLVSGSLLIAFASYVALPFGLASYIPRLAAQYGLRLDVDRVRVEPFRSRLGLSGARLATSGDSWIEWSSVEARVDLAQLLSGRLVLDDFRSSEATLRTGDLGVDAAGALPAAPTGLPEEMSVGELVIDGVELATVSEALGRPAAIDRLRLSSLNEVFRPEGAEVEADVSLGEGRSRLRGRLNFDEAGWTLDAEVGANDVLLDGVPALLGVGGSWRGKLDGAGPVRLVYAPANGAFSATASGRWRIDGPGLGLAQVAVSGARAHWDGAAFMTFSGGAVDALGIDGEMGLRELRAGIADMLEVEAAELTLQVDASRAPEARLSVEGRIPVARFNGRGGAFEALGAEATNLVSQVALTFADGVGVEIDRLKSGALAVKLPAGRSIDAERIELERVIVESAAGFVSAAAGTVERIDWRGFTGPRSTGTATGLATRRVERRGNDGLRLALASAETVEDRNGDSVLRLRDVALDGLIFDGESTVRTAGAFVERTYFRAAVGAGVDVTGLRADAVEWNGETLSAERGAAPLMSIAAAPVHASFDTVAFSSARLGAGGIRQLGNATSASGRGKVDLALEWSAGASALGGYHAPDAGASMLDFIETRDVEIVGEGNGARLRADRVAARGARIAASGETLFANAEADGITLDGGARGRAGASARALRASPLAIRESALEIGALSLSGVESAIGLSENGDWELPALPIGPGDAQSAFRVRIREAGTADSDSVIHVIDRTTEPDFAASIDVTSAALRGLGHEAIGVPARFSLEASADVFTALQAGGVLVPTPTGTDLDLNATIHGLSLRALSPYSRLHLGRSVEDGQADVTLDATIRASDLESAADFTMSRVVLGESESPAGSPGAGPVEASAFDTALDLLEDERGRVALEVPLRGKLDAPGFDFDGLVARALAGAALEAARSLPKAE